MLKGSVARIWRLSEADKLCLRPAVFTKLVQIINYSIDNVQELYIIKTVDSSIR